MSTNVVVLSGNLARDVELSYTPNSQMAVAHFTLAVNRPKRKDEEQQQADFIRITVFGKQAESCNRYLAKGRQAIVTGRIQTGSYQKDGQTVYTTDVIADRVEFIGGQGQGGGAGRASGAGAPAAPTRGGTQEAFAGFDDLPDTFQSAEDDIPF